MKVLIVSSTVPFVRDEVRELASSLQENLILSGHETENISLPFQEKPFPRIPSQMLMIRALELLNVDHVIALNFPATLIRHPRKTIWLLREYHPAYDPFETNLSHTSSSRLREDMGLLIKNANFESFLESRCLFCVSEVTRRRLEQAHKIKAKVLSPPTPGVHDISLSNWSQIIKSLLVSCPPITGPAKVSLCGNC